MSSIKDKYKVSNYETLSEKTRSNRFKWLKISNKPSVEEAYFEKYDEPYQREKLERTPEERQLERPKYIERNLLVTEAENLLRHGCQPGVDIILEDGEVIVDSDLNSKDDDLSYWEEDYSGK